MNYNQYWIDTHKPTGNTYNDLRERNRKFYTSALWFKTRLIVLNEYPICQACKIEPAFHCHHVKPLHSHWHLRLSLDNLESRCISCHSKDTAREQAELKALRIDDRMSDLNDFE